MDKKLQATFDRLKKEQSELNSRMLKLAKFCDTEKYKELPEPDRNDLRIQYNIMFTYNLILIKRITSMEIQVAMNKDSIKKNKKVK